MKIYLISILIYAIIFFIGSCLFSAKVGVAMALTFFAGFLTYGIFDVFEL